MSKLPEKSVIISNIQENIPSFLLEQPIWIAYYFKQNKDGTYSKPPCTGYSVKDDLPGKTFNEVIQHGFPGIKINKNNNLLAFDIDDHEAKEGKREFSIANFSQQFKDFIISHDSYMELSPSKCGARILFMTDDKSSLPGRGTLSSSLCIGGELFANSGYVTITGDYLSGSGIKSIEPSEIMQWIVVNEKPEPVPAPTQHFGDLPPLALVIEALNLCTLNKSSAIQRAYLAIMNQEYNHYDFWIRIMGACKSYAQASGKENEIVAAVLDWSSRDEESYQDEADVLTHWESLTRLENPVTWNTLFKFAKLIKFKWPKERFNKGNPTGKPLPNEIVNFKYLLDYYNIQIELEPYTKEYYISGDPSMIDKYFKSNDTKYFFGKVGPFTDTKLIQCFWALAQANHYDNITYSTISPLVKASLPRTPTFNILDLWLNTPYNELPEDLLEPNTDQSISNLDYLMSCITYDSDQNMELARKYLYAFFSGVVMPVYNKGNQWTEHNFMLILTGPENCRKTSFFDVLMPKHLSRYLIKHPVETLNSDKSLRDVKIVLASTAIVVIDEFELFYSKNNDAMFKNLVTCSTVDYVPIYEKNMVNINRTAALAGTTNKQSFPIEAHSSRRLAIIDVKWIDTDKVIKINWHKFYSNFVKEGKELLLKNKYGWKLDQADIDQQYAENERYRAQSNLEMIIAELFNFNYPFPGLQVISSVQTDNTWLYKRTDVIGIIRQKYPTINITPAQLEHVIKQLCGPYTKTIRQSIGLPNCSGEIRDGIVIQGQWKRYFLPPLRTDFAPN